MKKVYKSKVDKFLFGIVIVITFFPLVFLLYELTSFRDRIIVATILLLLALVFGNCIWGIRYIIDQEFLTLKGGFFFKKKISIKSIRKIEKVGFIAELGLGASLERIGVFYNKYDCFLISPKDRTAFIADLLEINPNIQVIV
ncbi:PH domain-containing protein [Capnocytophaga canimorsus]|uniref:Uncharacterized protein yyaB n=1 Tax=Capnocytophaga canimorsus (strain 5) TaxID=860228 RepID=F9YSK7_CAPCC|nr:PH domain-containing protein [Capnocytophaga canimorsus]AEK22680.1 Uncharacterized protein yyaB [Capnocytophaga canimorsus Cc5]CEN50474.1 conserved hypothetical protein [Capnocytophaga canimorsus]VEJ20053.1 Protein of uncharacterised function (DUF1200) [Capnocytophaga canimorsus]